MSAAQVPDGFRPIDVGGAFVAAIGPFHARWDEGRLLMGFRVEPRHCNPRGYCHGGMLAALADMMLPYGAMYQLDLGRRFTPTIALQVDYLAPAREGTWVEGCAEPLRSTSSIVFVQGRAFADGVPVVRASGIFRWGEPVGDGNETDPFGLRPGG